MKEKLIEDWLTKASERALTVPFAYLLVAEGQRVVHIDTHSGTEDGKDIIAEDRRGVLHGYQLKAGDIDVGRWRRDVEAELRELAQYPVHVPGHRERRVVPYLVTTGRLNSNTKHKLNRLNADLRTSKHNEVQLVEGPELVGRFIDRSDFAIPAGIVEYRDLLRFYTSSGQGMLPKARFARLMEQCFRKDTKVMAAQTRQVSAAAMVGSLAMRPFVDAENHWAVFEACVIVAASIAGFATRLSLKREQWRSVFDLVKGEAESSLRRLVLEAAKRPGPAEGNVVMDGGPPFRARQTILVGAASVLALLDRSEELSQKCDAFIDANTRKSWLWGESAFPFRIALAWYLRHSRSKSQVGEDILLEMIERIVSQRGVSSISPPYISVEQHVAEAVDTEPPWDEQRKQAVASYMLHGLVLSVVRSDRRTGLAAIWPEVPRVTCLSTAPRKPHDYLRWRIKRSGVDVLQQHFRPRESWRWLKKMAASPPTRRIPAALRNDWRFAICFMLVYPHRCTPGVMSIVDMALLKRAAER